MNRSENSSLLLVLTVAFVGWLVYQGILKNTPTSELIIEASQASFARNIQAKDVVLVDFWAPWCGPCRAMTPALNKVAETYDQEIAVVKLNVDEVPDIAQAYEVRYLPTVMLFKNGEEVNRSEGLQSFREMATRIDEALSYHN